MNFDCDVLVIGGGPSGSSTANFLRQKNRSAIVLEREKFPRFHIGESMLPFSNDIWKELGVLETIDAEQIHKPGAKFIHEESGAEFTYYFDTAIRPGRPYAYQVKRADFDKMLLDRARTLGADVREETRVADVKFEADGVVAQCEHGGEKYELRAPVIVDATGRDALLCNRFQLKEPDGLITTNVAVHTMFSDIGREPGRDAGNILLGLFDGGWWWVIPFKDGDTSVGMVFEKQFTKVNRGQTPEQMMYTGFEHTPYLKKIVDGKTRILPVGAQANWSYRSKRFYGDRFLMVGDSAAFVDPLFSTGVLLGINGAKFAAQHLDRALTDGNFGAAGFAAYQDQCVAGMDIFKKLVHEFYSENLRKLLLASARHPTMCAVITSLLAGDVFQPSMWHNAVKAGFSQLADMDASARVRSSRQVKADPPTAG